MRNLAEMTALQNEKRALQRELESVSNELRRVTGGYGVGYTNRSAPLQYRRQAIEARIQTIDERLRHV
jgi:Na+/H+-translocating membrane pyrophosphatase